VDDVTQDDTAVAAVGGMVDCYIAASSSDSEDELRLYWIILLQSTYHLLHCISVVAF
jgi:hypothetical protein